MSRRITAADLLMLVLTFSGAYLLKRHYSTASTDGLSWILRPTAALVQLLTGAAFTPESGAGYVTADRSFVIARPCAGVNFLIVAWCAAVVTTVRARPTLLAKALLVAGALAAAFVATLVVNSLRITLALALRGVPELPRDTAHHVSGTMVYVVGLCLFYLATQRLGLRGDPTAGAR